MAVEDTMERAGSMDPGAHDRIRTGDLVLTKDTLCRLSYVGLRAD
jgi:hypothetical protein